MTDIVSPLPTLARYAIMIDVGYIYAAAGELLFSVGSRREYRVDADKLIQALTKHADEPGPGRAAAGLLVRRGPGPGAHHRPAGHRPDGPGSSCGSAT